MKKIINLIISCALLTIMLTGCGQSKEQGDLLNSETTNMTNIKEDNENADGWSFSINTTDLYGTKITNEQFSQNELTILNVWATWCSPCIEELPELQKVSETYEEQGVQVIGVLQDGVTESGEPSDKVIENALKLLENANASYTVILPDEALTKEFISTMQYFPTTFFIDSEGNIIHTVIGAKDFENWSDEINEVLEQIS